MQKKTNCSQGYSSNILVLLIELKLYKFIFRRKILLKSIANLIVFDNTVESDNLVSDPHYIQIVRAKRNTLSGKDITNISESSGYSLMSTNVIANRV